MGQRRAAKIAARRRRGGGEPRSVPPLRPVLTLPGLDDYGPDDLPVVADALPELRLALAQVRAEVELGYWISPVDGAGDHPQDRWVEWTASVAGHRAAIEAAHLDETTCVTELVEARLRAAVEGTLATSSPEPARQEAACLMAADGGVTGRAQRAATAALAARLAGAAAPEPVLGWIAATLGAGPAAQAAPVAPVLTGAAVEPDTTVLVALLWLAAGAAAVGAA